jgi:hypothetical protein
MTLFQCYLKRLLAVFTSGRRPTLPKSSPSSPPSCTPEPSTKPNTSESREPRIALLAQLAEKEIGKKETKGRNLGPSVRQYQAATTLEPGAWPWCSAFVCWALEQWLSDPANVRWLALKSTTPARWKPKTALAYGFIAWAKARPATCTILSDTTEPQAGDLVCYDFSHIGIVKRSIGDKFEAIEGNTSGMRSDGTPSREGDGVYVKVRPRSLARCFIRIRPSGN